MTLSTRAEQASPDEASGLLDYPVENPPDIAPAIYRAMIIQTMAMEYFNAMRGSPEPFGMNEAFEAAQATWETDWSDQGPRTMEAAIQEVRADLSYWGEE